MKKVVNRRIIEKSVNKMRDERNKTVVEILRCLNDLEKNGYNIKYVKNDKNYLDVIINDGIENVKRLTEKDYYQLKISYLMHNEVLHWDMINMREQLLEQI